MLVLSLESSTNSAKAMLYDAKQGVIGVHTSEYPLSISRDGMSDTRAVCELTLALGKQLASGRRIDAVALCGTWHSIAICDGGMTPMDKTYSWNYMAPADSAGRIRADQAMAGELYGRTGCMPHVTYPRHALLYRAEQGDSFLGKKLISQGAYTFWRLTGEFWESVATVSGSGLLNIHTLDYDDYVLAMLGLQKTQLGRLVTKGAAAPLTSAGAEALGLAPGIPVLPAFPDGALNQFVSRAGKPRAMTLSVGTSGALRMDVDQPVLPDNHALWCYHGVEGRVSGAATAGACNCTNWFLRHFAGEPWSFERLEEGLEEAGGCMPVFLPFLFGERCPGWDDERRGGFFGLNGGHTLRDAYRAVQAGVLFNLLQCYEALVQANGAPESIIVSGGILNSAKWTQMLADIFGTGLICMNIIDASTLGAAVLAAQVLGGAGLEPVTAGARWVEPRAGQRDYYREQYARYIDFYRQTSARGD